MTDVMATYNKNNNRQCIKCHELPKEILGPSLHPYRKPLVFPNQPSSLYTLSHSFDRNYSRFKGAKMANTGLDPLGSLKEFIKKDIIKNIDVHKDAVKRVDDLELRKDRPAIGTTKKILGDKVSGEKATSLEGAGSSRVVRLKTDHISFNPPANEQKFQKVIDKVVTAAPYSGNFQTAKGWVERSGYKTVNNRSSVPYNIISNDDNKHSGAQIVRTLDKKVTNRKKGLAEFYDLTQVAAIKTNQGHQEAINDNPKVFYRKLGIFTNTYDAAVRNGNPNGPFKAKK